MFTNIYAHRHTHIYVYCHCSVAQSRPTFCGPMNCSPAGLPVHHQLPELAQTHVHWVSDAIQPPHPLLPPSLTLDLSQHQGLFQWVTSSDPMAKVLELQVQHQSFQWIFRVRIDWFDLLAVLGILKGLNSFLRFKKHLVAGCSLKGHFKGVTCLLMLMAICLNLHQRGHRGGAIWPHGGISPACQPPQESRALGNPPDLWPSPWWVAPWPLGEGAAELTFWKWFSAAE